MSPADRERLQEEMRALYAVHYSELLASDKPEPDPEPELEPQPEDATPESAREAPEPSPGTAGDASTDPGKTW